MCDIQENTLVRHKSSKIHLSNIFEGNNKCQVFEVYMQHFYVIDKARDLILAVKCL